MSVQDPPEKVQNSLILEDSGDVPPHIGKLRRILESRLFLYTVLVLICLNAVVLGAETIPPLKAAYGNLFLVLDFGFITLFMIELGLRIYAYRMQFFRNGWSIFDFIIIVGSALAYSSPFEALRAFRVLRVLHLVTIIPRMRVVVRSLIDSIPGIMSVGLVVVMIVYVFAVIAASLYGPTHPDLFGGVFNSMYTLFQVMTLEGWPDIAGAVGESHPNSWIFFTTFLLVGTFTMLNLFVAILVRVVDEDSQETEELLVSENEELRQEIASLRGDVLKLTRLVENLEPVRPVTDREKAPDPDD